MKKIKIGLKSYECDKYSEDEMMNSLQSLKKERDDARDAAEKAKAYKRVLKETNAQLKRERDGWREAAYSLGEAIPASWETLQPPAEQLRKFKEMVALENEKTKKLLDNADKHSKMYP